MIQFMCGVHNGKIYKNKYKVSGCQGLLSKEWGVTTKIFWVFLELEKMLWTNEWYVSSVVSQVFE